jgi:predicted nucleic acid-binding protein
MPASVISDASPIIALHACGRLALLRELYGLVAISVTVANEVEPSVPRLPDWIHVEPEPTPYPFSLGRGLDPGEASAIALAISISAATVLIDDLAARLRAERLGLHVVGSLGIAIRAKRFGIVPSARVVIDELILSGLYVSTSLYERALTLAGENQ